MLISDKRARKADWISRFGMHRIPFLKSILAAFRPSEQSSPKGSPLSEAFPTAAMKLQRGRQIQKCSQPSRSGLRRLQISPLEDRRLLSATATLAGGLLDVVGDGIGSNETVNVILNDVGGGMFDLQLQDENSNVIQIDGQNEVALSSITDGIRFDLAEGDDIIRLDVLDQLQITVIDDATGDDQVELTGVLANRASQLTIDAEQILIDGPIQSSGQIDFTGTTVVPGTATVDSLSGVAFNGPITGISPTSTLEVIAAGNIDVTDQISELETLRLESMADISLQGISSSLSTSSLEVTAAQNVSFNGNLNGIPTVDVTATQTVDFFSEVKDFGAGASSQLDVNADTINFHDQLTSYDTVQLDAQTEVNIHDKITDIGLLSITANGSTNFLSPSAGFVSADDVAISNLIQTETALQIEATQTVTLADIEGVGGSQNVEIHSKETLINSVQNVSQLNLISTAGSGFAGDVTLVSGGSVDGLLSVMADGTTTLGGALQAGEVQVHSQQINITGSVESVNQTMQLTADDLNLTGSGQIVGLQDLVIQTRDDTTEINVGGTLLTNPPAGFHLTEAEMQSILISADLFLGSTTHTGNINLFAMDLSLQNYDFIVQAASGSTVSILGAISLTNNNFIIDPPTDVSIDAPISTTGAGVITIDALNEIAFNAAGMLQTELGDVTLAAGNDVRFEQDTPLAIETAGGGISITADADMDSSGQILIEQNTEILATAAPGFIEFLGEITSSTVGAFDLTVTTAVDIHIPDAVSNLDVLSLNVGGTLLMESPITATNELQIGAGGATQFSGGTIEIGSGTVGNSLELLSSLNWTSTGTAQFAGAVFGSTGAETFQIDAGGGGEFQSTVSNLTELDVRPGAGQSLEFMGDIFDVGLFVTGTTGDVIFSAPNVTVGDAQLQTNLFVEQDLLLTVSNDISFTAGTTLGSNASSNLELHAANATFAQVENLSLLEANVSGATLFEGDITGLGTLRTDAAGTTEFVDVSVSAVDIELLDPVTTTGMVQLVASGSIQIGSTLEGADPAAELSLTAEGDLTFTGTINQFALLQTDVAGTTRFEGDVTNITQLTTTSRGSVQIATGSSSVTSGQFGNDVRADQSMTLTAVDGWEFLGTVSGLAGTEHLTVNAGAAGVDFDQSISHLDQLDVVTTGAAIFGGDISLETRFEVFADLGVVFDCDQLTAPTVLVHDAVRLDRSLVVTATTETIFSDVVTGLTGAEQLSIVSNGGNVEFQGAVTSLDSLQITMPQNVIFADVVTLTQDLTITGGTGLTQIQGQVTAGSVAVESGSIEILAGVITTTDGIQLEAATQVLIDAELDTSGATGTGNVSISASELIEFTAQGGIRGDDGSLIQLTADDGTAGAVGEIVMADGAEVTTPGEIAFQAAQDISLSHLQSSSSLADSIRITSRLGSVTDAGDLSRDIVSTGGVELSAATGIGDLNPLEIDVAQLRVDNGLNSTNLTNLGSVEVLGWSHTGGGSAELITESGSLIVAASGGGISLNGGALTLTAQSGGDIHLEQSVSTSGGDVFLTADAGITSTTAGLVSTSSTTGDAGLISLEVLQPGAIQLAGDLEATGEDSAGVNGGAGGNISMSTQQGDIEFANVTANGGSGTTTGGDAGSFQIDAGSGSILLNGMTTLLGGTGPTPGTDGAVTWTAGQQILDQNDGSTKIVAGDLTLRASSAIGQIDSFEAGTGNGIDLQISGQLLEASVTAPNGVIHLKQMGSLEVASGGLIPALNDIGTAVITATEQLNLGANPSSVVESAGDRLNFIAGTELILPDSGLDVADGELRLTGVTDVVDPSGRQLGTFTANRLVFVSGAAGGATELLTDVNFLDATITGAGQSLSVMEHDGIVLESIETNQGDVRIEAATAASGDIEVQHILADTALVVLDTSAFGGGILNGAGSATAIQSAELALNATTGVADGDLLRIEVDRIAAQTVQGDINLFNLSSALEVGTVDGLSGLVITSGTVNDTIDLRGNDAIQVVENVDAGDGTVAVASLGLDGTSLTIESMVFAANGITLDSGDLIQLTATGLVQTTTGPIEVTAGQNRNLGSTDSGFEDASFLMEAGSQIVSDSGMIEIKSTGDLAIAVINADFDLAGVAGDISLTADFLGINSDLPSGTGAISEVSPESETNLIGAQLTLTAATGIGAADDLRIDVENVVVTNGSGDIQLTEVATARDTALRVDSLLNDTGNVTIKTEDGSLAISQIDIVNSGDLTLLAEDASSDGDSQIDLEANIHVGAGDVVVTSSSNDINVLGTVQVDSGSLSVMSGALFDGQIFMADGAVFNADLGMISLTAFGDVTLGTVSSGNAASNAITIITPGAVIDGGDLGPADLVAESGGVSISAATGVGTGSALETAVGQLTIVNSTSGSVEIDEQTGVQILGIDQSAPGQVILNGMGVIEVVSSGTGIELQGGNLEITNADTAGEILLNQNVSTNGGAVQVASGQVFELGTGVLLATSGGDFTADVGAGNPAGIFEMAADAMIDLGTGAAVVDSGGNIILGTIQTTTNIQMTAVSGHVELQPGVAGTALSAEQLAISAATGIGSQAPLTTNVSTLALLNQVSGDIAVVNSSAQPLTIGTVAGLTGVEHSGASLGSISITNNADLNVAAAVTNQSGGDTTLIATGVASDLVVSAPIGNAFPGHVELDAGQDLIINDTGAFDDIIAGSIVGRAGNEVTIMDDVIVRSATGSVIDKLPLLENIVTPQVLATGEASVLGDFGRLLEQNYTIQVDWADGVIDLNPELAPTPDSFDYGHVYNGNPDPLNPAAPIPITVSIFDDPNIAFFEADVEVLLPSITSFADVPGEGLAGGIAFDLSIEIPEIGTNTNSGVDLTTSQSESSVEQTDVAETVVVVEESTLITGRVITLRVLDSRGQVIEEVILEEAEAALLLKDFLGFVEERDLPDGRYQILQQEPGELTPRVVFDLLLRDGRPADNSDGLQDRPPTENGTSQTPMQPPPKPSGMEQSMNSDHSIDKPTETASLDRISVSYSPPVPPRKAN